MLSELHPPAEALAAALLLPVLVSPATGHDEAGVGKERSSGMQGECGH